MHDWIENWVIWMVTAAAAIQCIFISHELYSEHRLTECKVTIAVLGTLTFRLLRILWDEYFKQREENRAWP